MSRRRVILIVVGIAGLVGLAVLLLRNGDASAPAPTSATLDDRATPAARPMPAPPAAGTEAAPSLAAKTDDRGARSLIARLMAYLVPERPLTEDDKAQVAALAAQLLGLGEAAAPALIGALDAANVTPGARDRLLNVLRQVPGPIVEDRLVLEARSGRQPSTRTMAIESLAARKTDRAMTSLAEIARNDPEVPSKPLIVGPRDPSDQSTELPDEQTFTPRMQAMAALAETKDPRAIAVLTDVALNGPDESLRMEAARHLGTLRDDPRAAEVLRAATSDSSPYVRLAALHSLNGSTDTQLGSLMERIIAHDRDAGVRILAKRVLAGLSR